MAEITPRDGTPRQSVAPTAPTAPGAPTIAAPGAPAATDPVSSGSRQRETEVQKKFRAIEEEYGGSKYLRHRRGEMWAKPAPATPVSDAYVITMRPKDSARKREMLDDLVVREEQHKREDWLREEEVRAAVLPHHLSYERRVAAQMEAIARMENERNKALAEQAARDAEAQKYGYSTHEELQQAIREEKAIKRANELGSALTEAQLISQTIAREGYSGAAAYYGRDPGEMIAEQTAKAEAAQQSLQDNFGITMDPSHGDYLRNATDYAATQKQQAAVNPSASTDPLVDQDTGLRLVKAGSPLKTSDYPAPSSSSSSSDREPSNLEQIARTHPVLLSPAGQFAQDVLRDRADVVQAQSDYETAYQIYDERYRAAEEAGLIVDGEFVVSDKESKRQYEELRIAAEAADQFAEKADDLQKRELFGIPAQFQQKERELAGFLNLPELTPDQARAAVTIRAAVDPTHPTLTPELADFEAGVLRGAYSGIRDRPLTGLASFGIGVLGGAAVKGATLLPKAGKIVPPTLKLAEGAWVGSIGARTAVQPDPFTAGETLGNILTTEALPVAAGASAVQRVPNLSPRPSTRPTKPSETPPARQTVIDVSGEAPPIREIASVGRTKIYDATGEIPDVRPLGRDPTGVRVYDASGEISPIREIASVGRTKIYDATGEIPDVRPLGRDPAGVRVYDASGEIPEIRFLGRDPAGVRVFDATGELGDPQHLGIVDAAPPKIRQPSRSKPSPKSGDGAIQTLYTPEALGAKQRATMIQRRRAKTGSSPGPAPVVREVPKISLSPRTQTQTQTKQSPRPVGLLPIPSALSQRTQDRAQEQDRAPVRVAPPSISSRVELAELTDPGQAVRVDLDIVETPIDASRQAPERDQPQLQTPEQAVDIMLRQEQIIVQAPRQIQRPRQRPRPRPRPPRTPRGIRLPESGPKLFGDEFYVHYAERPTPHARLEEAYTDLTGPKIRPAKLIRNLQRITIGNPPRTPRRRAVARTGQSVRRAATRVPWDIPLSGSLGEIPGIFGSTPKKQKNKRRRR